MTHYVIYVPGLGDAQAHGQRLVTKLWALHGLHGQYEPMLWADKQAYASKLQRLLARIDQLQAGGNRVSLIGTSAGASAVLNAYALRKDKITAVVCVCGKIQHPETVGAQVYAENPAFKISMQQVAASLAQLQAPDRRRILSIHPKSDSVVPVVDTIIEGAHEGHIPTSGHALSIAYALTFGMLRIGRFIKQQA